MAKQLLLLSAILAGCASSEGGSPSGGPLISETRVRGPFRVHALYRGLSRPLDKLAVLLVVSPSSPRGLGVVGRVTHLESGADYRPSLDIALLELEPGPYRLELWYWVGRSRFEETAAGERGLKFESLRSGEVAVMETRLEAGEIYFIDPELRRQETVVPAELDSFHGLVYGESFAQMKSPPPAGTEPVGWVWRPRLATLTGSKAARYRSYR